MGRERRQLRPPHEFKRHFASAKTAAILDAIGLREESLRLDGTITCPVRLNGADSPPPGGKIHAEGEIFSASEPLSGTRLAPSGAAHLGEKSEKSPRHLLTDIRKYG
jgi:hypothetical protein